MFKGLRISMCLIVAFFMLPAVAWSEPESGYFPTDPALLAFDFPVHTHSPNPNTLLKEANKVRQAAGVQPLRANKYLSSIAEQRAADMSVRQYYSHKNPDGLFYYDQMSESGMTPDYSCENLDLVFTYSDTIVVSDWMQSPKGHRECLLNKDVYETGIAVVPYSQAVISGRRTTIFLVVAIHATNI